MLRVSASATRTVPSRTLEKPKDTQYLVIAAHDMPFHAVFLNALLIATANGATHVGHCLPLRRGVGSDNTGLRPNNLQKGVYRARLPRQPHASYHPFPTPRLRNDGSSPNDTISNTSRHFNPQVSTHDRLRRRLPLTPLIGASPPAYRSGSTSR